MKINIAIETKDRRLSGGENYLRTTLENMQRAGILDSPHLNSLIITSGGEQPGYYDEQVLPVLRHLEHEYVHPPAGCTRQQNAARAIRYGAMNSDGEWVLKLEDDLDFLDGFMDTLVDWLGDHGKASVPMFSLASTYETVSTSIYSEPGETVLRPGPSFPRVRAMMARGDAIAAYPVRGFWGAQALVWRRPMARNLADWLGDDPFLWDGKEQHRERGHDLLLQVWGTQLGAKVFGVAIPSFVQHIGRQSNIQNKFFEYPFPGRSWSYQRRTIDA